MSTIFIRSRPRRNVSAFSLVEVVLAIGIVSLGILVIIALVPSAIRAGKDSSQDLALSLMTENTVANLRLKGLAALNTLADANGTLPQYNYDVNGHILATPFTGCYYICLATPIHPASAAVNPINTTNFVYVQLQYSWPTNAPVANRQQAVIVTSIGNYD